VAGQGTGVAAAIALALGCPLDAVPLERVQKTLQDQGVRLH
jgi:hypothetical protein